MADSLKEVLAGCVTNSEAAMINVTRGKCERIVARLRPVDLQEAGRIIVAAERAEEALFDLLVSAHAYGHCAVAEGAIDTYRRNHGA